MCWEHHFAPNTFPQWSLHQQIDKYHEKYNTRTNVPHGPKKLLTTCLILQEWNHPQEDCNSKLGVKNLMPHEDLMPLAPKITSQKFMGVRSNLDPQLRFTQGLEIIAFAQNLGKPRKKWKTPMFVLRPTSVKPSTFQLSQGSYRTLVFIEGCFNTPVEHTPGNPPNQLWKKSLFSLLVKGLGVCSKGVLKKPLISPFFLGGGCKLSWNVYPQNFV